MRAIALRWRRSLAWRVTTTILVLSVIVISLVGTTIYNKLSQGIFQEKLNTSIYDATTTTRSAQLQLALAPYERQTTVAKIVGDILSTTSVESAGTGRDVALLPFPVTARQKFTYKGTSNQLSLNSIPVGLRTAVRAHSTPQWDHTSMVYADGKVDSGIVVGNQLIIPNSGRYEFYVFFSLKQQSDTLNLIIRNLVIAGLGLLLFIALLTLLLTRQVISPLREAARIAEKLASGDLEQRMDVHGESEIARLALAFNDMAVSLNQQISRLENLSRLQQRFVSDVSHELRTPLTTIRMAAQVIDEAKSSFDPVLARSAELLVAQTERFENLLADLLEVSRFDAQAAILDIQKIDINELVRRTSDYLDPHGDRIIHLHLPQHAVWVEADARRIERILRNLITNAIDHREEGQVDVTVAEGEPNVAVSVRDYGVGFSEKDRPFLFERFWRADPSRSRIRGGTGLGLAISLEDATLHQGTLQAWGMPGKGANFLLNLPKRVGDVLGRSPLPLVPEEFTTAD